MDIKGKKAIKKEKFTPAQLPVKYDQLTRNEGWYSLTPILSYGRHLNIITGESSTGKSTAVALKLVMHYLETGKGWIYSRRTKDETEKTAPTYFDNACEILQQHGVNVSIEYKGGTYYYKGNKCGVAIPMSLQAKHKSENLSFADWIVYDEFISENGLYIGGQVDPLREYRFLMRLYITADRGVNISRRNTVKIIAMANSSSYYNPIYMAKGIDRLLRTDTHFLAPKGEEWILQQLRPEDAPSAADYKNSIAYKLADDETKAVQFGNSAKEARQNSEFIRKSTEPRKGMFNLVFDGQKMGVYLLQNSHKLYISKEPTELETFSLTGQDHRPDYYFMSHSTVVIAMIQEHYNRGDIYFETARIKYNIDNYLKFIV